MAPTEGERETDSLKDEGFEEELKGDTLLKEVPTCELGASLNKVCLSGLALEEVPSHLEKLESLLEVDLSNNKLSSLPPWFSKLCRLRVLNLSNNLFAQPPQVLYKGLHIVRDLNLSQNCLTQFNEKLSCLAYLKILRLRSNKLQSPPSWLYSEFPSSLELVDLSLNPYLLSSEAATQVEDNSVSPISNSVQVLLLSENRMSDSHFWFINSFANLRSLDLSNRADSNMQNNFQDMPSKILSLAPTLSELNLENVGLPGLENSISSFVNLTIFNLSSNIINWLPASICLLPTLRVCRLSNCRLYFLPNDIGGLTTLTQLYLDGNEVYFFVLY